MPILPNVWIWFHIRFLLGLSSELVWTAGDVWINQPASQRKRGRIIDLTVPAVTFGQHESSARILHFLKVAPGSMIAGFMFELIDSVTLSLLPVYGLRKDLSSDLAEAMLSIFVIGAMLNQIPMGVLVEKFGARKLILSSPTLS